MLTRVGDGGRTVTATAAVTLGSATERRVTRAVPGATPVTTPCAVTVATAELSISKFTSRLTFESASTVAAIACDWPGRSDIAGGKAVTERTPVYAGMTVTGTIAIAFGFAADLTVITPDPTDMPVRIPLSETATRRGSADDQMSE